MRRIQGVTERQRMVATGFFTISLIAMAVIQFQFFAPRTASISYREFKALVKKGKVTNLILGRDAISGTLSTDGLEGLSRRRVSRS